MAAIVVVPHDLLGDALLPETQSLVNDHHDVEVSKFAFFFASLRVDTWSVFGSAMLRYHDSAIAVIV